MIKKIICIGSILVLMFAITACIHKGAEYEPEKKGDFYTLQEAYNLELLTRDDLKSIAYYHNGTGDDESFVPLPKTPETLSVETENAIKETRAYDFRNMGTHPIKDAKIEDITIHKYYGTYNDCVAVMMYDYNCYPAVMRDDSIAGVLFNYSDGNSILIWKDSSRQDD